MNSLDEAGFIPAGQIQLYRASRIWWPAIWHLICGGIVTVEGVAFYFWLNKEARKRLGR
jgi:hypothetical protein